MPGVSIPRIFHHIWVSGDEMPEAVRAARQTWIVHHPDWEFRVWRLEDLTWLRNQRLFDRAVPYSQKADFARYEVVHRFGGIYLDSDMECLRPLDPLLDGCRFLCGREPNGFIASSIFGAAPAHPIPREVIRRLPASCFFHPADQLGVTTGPHLLTRTIRDGGWEKREGVYVFPSAYFSPYAGAEPWRRGDKFPRAYAVHHWTHSWKGQRGVTPKLVELFPRKGAMTPSVRALWREATDRALTVSREDLLKPAWRVTKRLAQRVMPALDTLHGVPWGRDEVLVATPFGTRLLCPTNDLSLAPELALTGRRDQPLVDFLERRLKWGMTFVDVGANVGLFTVLGAACVGRGGRVFVFETDPERIRFIQRNVEMNRFDDRVRLIPPPYERLDEALDEVPYIDLLRVDIQDEDAPVLDGASGLLDRGRVGIITTEFRECVPRAEHAEELGKMVKSLVNDRGATLHVPADPRRIPLDEALTVFDYPQLLIRLPGASIEP